MAVNILAIIPIIKVRANPLMGPDPKLYNTIPAIRVVTLASRMVIKARLYPVSTEDHTVLPLSISSLIRSKINRHTDGKDDTGNTWQGQGGMEIRHDAH